MANPRDFNFEKPVAVMNDEDEATLAAVRAGVRDAKASRTLPAGKVRKLLRLGVAY